MRKSQLRPRIEAHNAGKQIRWHTWANARFHLTSEANAAAKTNGAFDAAAPLYERVPWRARPPYEREEKD